MVRGLTGMFPEGQLLSDHFPLMGFIERAQAFSLGAIAMIEQGNPLSAATLLRSLAENVATAYFIDAHPSELDKLRPAATEGLKIGRVVAAADKSLPGFKAVHDRLSRMAHPSGAGAFHTLRVSGGRVITWQSHPDFRSVEDARALLDLLDTLVELSGRVIRATVRDIEAQGPVRSDVAPSAGD